MSISCNWRIAFREQAARGLTRGMSGDRAGQQDNKIEQVNKNEY
jgi:hypothetical protein